MLLHRVLVAVFGVPVILAVLFYGGPTGNLILFTLAFLAGMAEYVAMAFKGQRREQVVAFLAGLWTYSVIIATPLTGLGPLLPMHASTLAFGGAAALSMLYFLFFIRDMHTVIDRIGRSLLGSVYVGGLFSLLPLMILQGSVYQPDGQVVEYGPRFVLLLMAVVWGGDTGAYFAGRGFGRHKLYPEHLAHRVSPNKTWEGSFGGLAGSVGMGFLFWHFMGLGQVLSPGALLTLALIGGAVEQVGDLFESLIKRSVEVKDSGHLLPGHGGILDRLDGILFAAPVFYLALTITLAH